MPARRSHNPHPICRRLKALRLKHFGERGQSRFARELGIGPSTYAHYETDRIPPAPLLLRACEVTGASLTWLIADAAAPRSEHRGGLNPAQAGVVDQLEQLLLEHPELTAPVTQFVDALRSRISTEDASPAGPAVDRRGLIPVVGSTAAGTARYWEELPELIEGSGVDAQLELLLSGVFESSQAASASRSLEATPSESDRVALVQFATPDAHGVLEFIDARGIRTRFPSAVAWRIDGDSMSPRYQDGDLVITSPDAPAVEQQPCVARQRGQIGVNCKLFRREGDDVLLIPINDRHPVQRVPLSELVWAWRVVSSVRIG